MKQDFFFVVGDLHKFGAYQNFRNSFIAKEEFLPFENSITWKLGALYREIRFVEWETFLFILARGALSAKPRWVPYQCFLCVIFIVGLGLDGSGFGIVAGGIREKNLPLLGAILRSDHACGF